MKIVEVEVYRLAGVADPQWAHEERSASPLDIYPEYAAIGQHPPEGGLPVVRYYVFIRTDEGLDGLYGPIVYEEQAALIARTLRPRLIGREALHVERLWDELRHDRHGRSGYYMMALSAVDCALWDLRGKYYGAPVYKLLGGPTRDRIPVYASALGCSLAPGEVGRQAKAFADQGFAAQKWFFRYGPSAGAEGREANLRLAREVREAIGGGDFMLDCWMSWDVPYAADMTDRLRELRPLWLEEPLSPGQLDGYAALARRGSVPLAAGEHLYTRREFKPLLDRGALAFIQPDPDWTGGITELRKIAVLAEAYDVKFVPHGCTVLPNLHVIASLPPMQCPFLEYLIRYQRQQSHFHVDKLIPSGGFLELPDRPGLGIELDESAIESKTLYR